MCLYLSLAKKDIAYNPQKPEQMVCATKDRIYLSEDAGMSWTYYNSPRIATSGIKAVAVATLSSADSDGTVSSDDYIFCSHATLGFFYSKVSNKKMVNAAAGLAGADPNVGSDEVSDILPVLCRAEDGSIYTEIFLCFCAV